MLITSCVSRSLGRQFLVPPSKWRRDGLGFSDSPRRSCRRSRCPTAGPRTSRSAVTTFRPPIGAPLPGAVVSLAMIGSPASVAAFTASGDSFFSRPSARGVAGCVDARVERRAEVRRQLLVVLARVLAGPGRDLGGQQVRG